MFVYINLYFAIFVANFFTDDFNFFRLSVRASDYYTSRQLLILYSLVSSESGRLITPERTLGEKEKLPVVNTHKNEEQQKSLLDSKVMLMRYSKDGDPNVLQSVKKSLLPRPPPPPLDTDRLRSATNSDGLLAGK